MRAAAEPRTGHRQPVVPGLDERSVYAMRHALGLNYSKDGKSYRNYYVTGFGSIQQGMWNDLVERGYARLVVNDAIFCSYALTPEGARLAAFDDEELDPEDFNT